MSQPHLPPDIDRLLWEVAESQDPSAYDDFEARFPQLVVELGKRIKLVRELRDARDNADFKKPVPRFDRREPTPTFRLTPALATICIVGLVAIGLGAYTLTSHYTRSTPVPVVQTSPPELPNASIKTIQEAPAPKNIVAVPEPQTNPIPPPKNSAPAYLKPLTVSFDREKLQVAMQAVAVSGGLSIEFAPNTPNPEIRMQYQQMNSIDILKDLGTRFGFTAFDEGNHVVLIVPTRDPASSDQPSPSGTAENLDTQEPSPSSTNNPKKIKTSSAKTTGPI